MSRRATLILLAAVPVVALFSLLGWALVRSGGGPLPVNSRLGEVSIKSRPAPDLKATTLDGQELDLSALRGKVVMVDFWSSWCPPCRKEAPVLAQVYRQYKGLPVEFVAIAIWDKKDAVMRHIGLYNVPYPNIMDPKGKIGIEYGVTGIPEKYFVDPQGRIVRKFIGPMNAETLRSVLDEMLASRER